MLINIGEWKHNKLNGCSKVEYLNGDNYLGEFNEGSREGYGTFEYSGGDRYMGQWF